MKGHFQYLVVLLLLAWLSYAVKAQGTLRVAFYNTENLFDTLDTEGVADSEFTPEGAKEWGSERYSSKLAGLARVIASMGARRPPEILGLCEVENVSVIRDLVNQKPLRRARYRIVHYDSPDGRGIDVALLYRRNVLKVLTTRSLPVEDEELFSRPTRDVLLVSGLLRRKDTLNLFVVHYPSRVGGTEASEPRRMRVSEVVRHHVDSLLKRNPQSKILVMGDFNDEPANRSVREVLNASGELPLEGGELYNPMFALNTATIGSYNYRDTWNMLDQIIVSAGLLDGTRGYHYVRGSANVFNVDWLRQQEGRYKGYPDRTYAGNLYLGGYSDHFPVFIDLTKR